jgi:hypothetical protein
MIKVNLYCLSPKDPISLSNQWNGDFTWRLTPDAATKEGLMKGYWFVNCRKGTWYIKLEYKHIFEVNSKWLATFQNALCKHVVLLEIKV